MTPFLVVLSLLFSQLALASYVCPGVADPAAMAEAMASGEPCEGMDKAQPVLCHQYATSAPQSVEQAKAATPSLPAIVQVLILPAVLDAASTTALGGTAAPEARPPPEPVFLSTLRLRV
ncbi:hypothetical protein C7T35_17775 [Variovorax sp. WS11]|nr:hypothetical protein [Variovorax sp. WS11]PSL83310.1 hypothetical protein C7T35_17775 [Variovorax sp. WS11]